MSQLVQLLQPSLVFLDLEFANKEEALNHLAQQMVKQGFAKESYPEAILLREITFPTGLQTNICGVAIPHTDPIHVKLEAVSFSRLRQPVHFQMMGMNDQQVSVSLIFMLAIKEAHGQLEMLQELTSIFQNQDRLKALLQATSAQEALHSLQSIGKDDTFERSNP
jgi:PTS system galactitol-specific IIA component